LSGNRSGCWAGKKTFCVRFTTIGTERDGPVRMLLLAHLCGPPARNKPNSQLFSAAQSRDEAAIIFSLAAKMVRMNPILA
jgi:hypothetical protein